MYTREDLDNFKEVFGELIKTAVLSFQEEVAAYTIAKGKDIFNIDWPYVEISFNTTNEKDILGYHKADSLQGDHYTASCSIRFPIDLSKEDQWDFPVQPYSVWLTDLRFKVRDELDVKLKELTDNDGTQWDIYTDTYNETEQRKTYNKTTCIIQEYVLTQMFF